MPVAAGPQAYHGQFPSFMSVFGVEASDMGATNETTSINDNQPETSKVGTPQSQPEPLNSTDQTDAQHQHRGSTSTQASESTDSSPTTTISTVDSSSLTDPSPSSSPQSPVTIVPLSSFAATNFTIGSLDDLTMSDKSADLKPLSYDRPMTSPSPRKPRNAKGLALKLSSLGGEAPQQSPMPVSPSFVKPPTMKPRKKPSILSLQTSANPTVPNSFGRFALDPPPTPGAFRDPVLRHAASSPQMLFSPGPRGAAGPEGGMQLPTFERSRVTGLSNAFRRPSALKESSSFSSGPIIDEEESPIKAQMATRSMQDISGDVFDRPPSQEDSKSPGYPNGPIAIYEPYVYLYLEPTMEEALRFDVIMNVASEVRNPFQHATTTTIDGEKPLPPLPKTSFDDVEIARDNIPEPSTAMSTATFKTAFEFQPGHSSTTPTESSPTTPKPAAQQPEYIHVPWEHNTDISKDLFRLCETIESRTTQGKKVLIHCQQGASRSASLIIAYGMFKNPNLTVNEAYLAAQEKSQWISPNMKLMYALQDFHKELERKKVSSGSGFGRIAGRSPTRHRTTLSADNADISSKEPLTAPLPSMKEVGASGGKSARTSSRTRGNSTPGLGDISPGPSSAPSSFCFSLKPATGSGLWSLRRPSTGSASENRPVFRSTSSQPSSSPKIQEKSGVSKCSPSLNGFSFQRNEVGYFGKVGAKAPPSLFAPKERRTEISALGDLSNIQRQFAVRQAGDVPQSPALWSPRIQEMTGNPIRSTFNFSAPFSRASQKIDSPGSELMSPRVAEFSGNPFHQSRSINAQVAASSFGLATTTSDSKVLPKEDPRSPAMKGEAPIIRSIDDVL
ncbi:MAG: hypothetical protein M1818_004599 [Claussenomyces sp. TS43310]|nr:MAG: hypothetical protein M1818_004599 [Claussenomyces sp. TS43310]